jgi:putative transposase
MLLAHKIELRPTPQEAEYLDRACGSRRHCFNQLLAHFKQDGVKWSKANAYQHYINVIRKEFPWYNEVSSRVTRNAIDDLDNAYKHFFRRVKAGQKPGYPQFKKKGISDSFAMREQTKFDVDGRTLRIEKLKSRIKMAQAVRFEGEAKQVTISKRAGRYFASILVDVTNYIQHEQAQEVVGVDFGVKNLAILSTGEKIPASNKLKSSLRRLKRLQRNLSRKQKGSARRAKAKQRVQRLHLRVANQRAAMLHELSDKLTREYKVVVIEDLNVRGMVKNRSLARAVSDAGFGMLRQQLEYKARLRGGHVVVADRFFASTKTCSDCGEKNPQVVLGVDEWVCPACGSIHDRDINAAINLLNYGRDTFWRDHKRAQESSQTETSVSASALTVRTDHMEPVCDFM